MTGNFDNRYKYHLLGILAISVFCIIIYSNTLNSPFVFDDFPNLKTNPYIRLTNLDFVKLYDAGFKSRCPNRPVANISFALNYYFGRYNATVYHIVNIVIHIINGILAYFLALIIFRQLSDIPGQKTPQPFHQSIHPSVHPSIILMSLFTALIFVAHPLQTQSVTYIVQRMTAMAAMFFLLSLLCYIRGRLSETRWKRWALFSACFLSLAMAIGSKEIAVTLPFFILLYEWYFFQDLSVAWLKRNIKYVLIPIAVLFLFALVYLGGNPFDRILAGYTSRDFTMWERVLTQFRVVVFYISLLLYPHPSRLNLIHHFTTSHSLFDPITTLLSLVIIASLTGLAIYLARMKRLISFCILWFIINLAIESSVLSLEMIYEHRLYLPMFGFALLASYLPFYFLSNKRLWAVIILVIVTVSLGTGTYLRNKTWQNEITLWSDVLSKNPQSYRAHDNLGIVLLDQDRIKEAISHFSEALRIKHDYENAYNNLGNALLIEGRLNEAISHFSEALRIKPDYADAHYNLGRAIERQGSLDKAIGHYQKALRLNGYLVDAYINLGNALMRKGNIKDAFVHFSAALQIDPGDVKALANLGVVFLHQGCVDEAIDHFSEALRINPDDAKVHSNLGVALVRKGSLKEAIDHFSEALRINPDDADARYNLEFAKQLMGKSSGPSKPAMNQ